MTRAERIRNALTNLQPVVLEIEDESHQHLRHRKALVADMRAAKSGAVDAEEAVHAAAEAAGRTRRSPETHFKVLVVSDVFKGLARVARQRRVYDLLQDEMKRGLHALSIRALTPEEHAQGAADGFISPSCRGSGD